MSFCLRKRPPGCSVRAANTPSTMNGASKCCALSTPDVVSCGQLVTRAHDPEGACIERPVFILSEGDVSGHVQCIVPCDRGTSNCSVVLLVSCGTLVS